MTERLEKRLVDSLGDGASVDRRTVLGGLGIAGSAALGFGSTQASAESGHDEDEHGNFGAVDEYQDTDFDPYEFLTAFNTGTNGQDAVPQRTYEKDGRTVREFELVAVDTTITIAPGIEFEAWAYNGQVPGPTLRAVEGDLIRVSSERWR